MTLFGLSARADGATVRTRHGVRRAGQVALATSALHLPPEPLAYLGIQATRWSLARAGRRDGRRNLWLRALDVTSLGFDS
jgi:hypothetical protein